jgi:hypothetical protein
MHVYRMAMLLSIYRDDDGNVVIGLKDEKQKQRLAYEAVKYMLENYKLEKGSLSESILNHKKYRSRMRDLREFALAYLSDQGFRELFPE